MTIGGGLKTELELKTNLIIDYQRQREMNVLIRDRRHAFKPEGVKRKEKETGIDTGDRNIWENQVFGRLAADYKIGQTNRIVQTVPLESRRGHTTIHYGCAWMYDASYCPHSQANQIHVEFRDISPIACRNMDRYVSAVRKKYGSDYAPSAYLDDMRWIKHLPDRELILDMWLCRVLGYLTETECQEFMFEVGRLYRENPYFSVSVVQALAEHNSEVPQGKMRMIDQQKDVLSPLSLGAGQDLRVIDPQKIPYYHTIEPPYYYKLCTAFTVVRP